MKIPKSIRLNGVEYLVEIVSGLNDGCAVLYGQVDHGKSIIRINETVQGYQMKCITLLHEIGHVICRGISEEPIQDEEKIVDVFSKGMYALLQDNGKRLFDLKDEGEPKDGEQDG